MSARQSRKRKKQYLKQLDDRASALQAQLHDLRHEHAAGAHAALREARARLLASMEALASKTEHSAEEAALLEGEEKQREREWPAEGPGGTCAWASSLSFSPPPPPLPY